MPPYGLNLLKTGTLDLIIDSGRPGLRDRGVGPGGPADRWSFTLANALAGNPPEANAAALEFSLVGPTLQAITPVAFGVSGSVSSARIHHLDGTTHQLNPWSSGTLEPGETLALGPVTGSLRGYLAVQGGFETPRMAGSRQSLAPLRPQTLLPAPPARNPFRHMAADWALPAPDTGALRVLPGPQWDLLGWPENQTLSATVDDRINRMGVRLRLKSPAPPPPVGLTSEPVCPGIIQAPSSGEWIILGMGCQTLGGYAKVAQVIEADLDRVGRLRPGDPVLLRAILLSQALEINR
ncbi:MAG: biotin-dependent carboxyltransferase family protein, partial [Gemmataceae bacterium]